ncbi:hypothetical protein PV08_05563 [Exophiala spinifera]|uniref:Autophagy-related protein 29 n=1 Tax=Exophiala spinifera TaxID=91928 RepID=A0A0D1ZRY2_9EURO|nr:uncharacterized protein PV08_05563 [Exophiala spinifera]KIW15517.1 hypothetical protein PV08_05563 [Exophiala spinifera]
MAQIEHHFTVFIRLPFNRGDFIDPPPVAWSATKESALWNIISRQSKGNEIDWRSLSEQFEVSQSFLLQQAAWLYERQLSQVRAQMRRVGGRQSATPSPVPGSVSASMVGGQAMKRAGSGGSRVPSRLSTQAAGSPIATGGDSVPGTPGAKVRTFLPFRSASNQGAGPSQPRVPPGSSRPISRQSFKDDPLTHTSHSRRGSMQHQVVRSPVPQRTPQPQSSDSEDEMTQSRIAARRPNPSAIHRRALSQRQSQRISSEQAQQAAAASDDDNDDDEDDEPSFLPFATPNSNTNTNEAKPSGASSSQQDPSATLRGNLHVHTPGSPATTGRPNVIRRITSERVSSPTIEPPTPIAPARKQDTASSTSSLSSPTNMSREPSSMAAPQPPPPASGQQQSQSTATNNPRLGNPLSPPHRALLQSSPRRGPGSDTSPSMGSSFSDLDDASVTQSALEEALLSGMGNTTMTMPGGGVAGRVSGISQALRSRYFEARGEGQRGGGGNNGVSER